VREPFLRFEEPLPLASEVFGREVEVEAGQAGDALVAVGFSDAVVGGEVGDAADGVAADVPQLGVGELGQIDGGHRASPRRPSSAAIADRAASLSCSGSFQPQLSHQNSAGSGFGVKFRHSGTG
jgi:hypothetical protein